MFLQLGVKGSQSSIGAADKDGGRLNKLGSVQRYKFTATEPPPYELGQRCTQYINSSHFERTQVKTKTQKNEIQEQIVTDNATHRFV